MVIYWKFKRVDRGKNKYRYFYAVYNNQKIELGHFEDSVLRMNIKKYLQDKIKIEDFDDVQRFIEKQSEVNNEQRRSKMKKRLTERIKSYIEICKKRYGVEFTVSECTETLWWFQ